MFRFIGRAVLAAVFLWIGACANLPHRDPPQVTVAGIESLPGEGLEIRMNLKLRVQNPNDAPIEYDGAYVKLSVQDKTFATGVSDASGTVPRFGESVIVVPVTVSMMNIVRQVLGAIDSQAPPPEKIHFTLEGKLNGSGFSSVRFKSKGDLELPAPTAPATGEAQG